MTITRIMNNIKRLLDLIQVLVFTRPKRAEILVFDNCGIDILLPIINGEKYEVLYVRRERFNVNLFLCVRWAIEWVVYKDLSYAYKVAFLKMVRPKVVLTFIDNSPSYWRMDKEFGSDSVTFISIANGRRPLLRDVNELYHSNLFCWGDIDMNRYQMLGANVVNYFPYGSLKDTCYRQRSMRSFIVRYDVAVVSEGWHGVDYDGLYGSVKKSYELMCRYVREFVVKHGCSLAVVCRSKPDSEAYFDECEYFRGYFGNKVDLVPNSDDFGSYSGVDSARVVIADSSSMLWEAYGRGKKVLSCAYSEDPDYIFPISGICSITEKGYDLFDHRLSYLLSISEDAYFSEIGVAPNCLVAYDELVPLDAYLKSFIGALCQGRLDKSPDSSPKLVT